MPRWLSRALSQIRAHAVADRVQFTWKAREELALLGLGLAPPDACELLMRLSPDDSVGRRVSVITGEWFYVFKPVVAGTILYVKLILQPDCLVISFHEDDGADDDEDDEDDEA